MRKPREFFGMKRNCENVFHIFFNVIQPKTKNDDFQTLYCAHFLLSNFNYWSRYFSKHFWKPQFRNFLRSHSFFLIANITKPLQVIYKISKVFFFNFELEILPARPLPSKNQLLKLPIGQLIPHTFVYFDLIHNS